MVTKWNSAPGRDDEGEPAAADAASMAPGPNVSRRRFVEIAVSSLAGASLVGLGATSAAAAPSGGEGEWPPMSTCRGAEEGPVADVLHYEDLVDIHLATAGR